MHKLDGAKSHTCRCGPWCTCLANYTRWDTAKDHFCQVIPPWCRTPDRLHWPEFPCHAQHWWFQSIYSISLLLLISYLHWLFVPVQVVERDNDLPLSGVEEISIRNVQYAPLIESVRVGLHEDGLLRALKLCCPPLHSNLLIILVSYLQVVLQMWSTFSTGIDW